MQGEWFKKPMGATTVVFVHGILSSGEECWRNKKGSYWPDLLAQEPELGAVGIYIYTYQTGVFSGSYSVSNIVDDLKERLKLDKVMSCRQLIFVCHSMGGIVVRKYLVERVLDIVEHKLNIGLFLVASPSLGSDYANYISLLTAWLGHAQAQTLGFSQHNNWLNDLDKEFKNLKEGNKLHLCGKELIEDKPIILKKSFFQKQIVEPFSAARYFGDPYKVPGSDHSSIAKPENPSAMQHRLLLKFTNEFIEVSENILEQGQVDNPQAIQIKNDQFTQKIREEIRRILTSGKPATVALRETLQKNQPSHLTPDQILIPSEVSMSPETAIRTWRTTVETCLQESREHLTELKQYANEVMGWLILLSVDGGQVHGNGVIDLENTTEVAIPLRTDTGTEIFIARLREKPARFQLKGSDKVLSDDAVDPADLELAFSKQDCLREIEKLVYLQVFKAQPGGDDWLGRLRNYININRDRNKMYFLKLPQQRRSEFVTILPQLKVDLPDLRILITGTESNGGNSVLIIDETRLESLVLVFLNTLADYS